MGTDPSAKLFYGYVQPEADREEFNEDDAEIETSWSQTHTERKHSCVGGIYGYSGSLGFFLAIEKSLHEAEWDTVIPLTQKDLEIQPTWNEQLQEAAKAFELDVSEIQPGWHLVCLYF